MKNEQLIERVEKRVDKAIKGKTFTSETARAWAECSLAFSRALREELAAVVRIEPAPKDWSGYVYDVPEWVEDMIQHEGSWYFASRRLASLPTNTEDTNE